MKTAAKKAATKKTPIKKTTAKKAPAAKKTPAKKATAKKAAAKKPVVKKTPTITPTPRNITAEAPGAAGAARPAGAPAPAPVVPANELKIGVVTHYYSHLSVAVVSLTDRAMQIGDRIHLKGHTTDFYQTVASMEVEHQPVSAAAIGQTVGLKVDDHAREHDAVYLVT